MNALKFAKKYGISCIILAASQANPNHKKCKVIASTKHGIDDVQGYLYTKEVMDILHSAQVIYNVGGYHMAKTILEQAPVESTHCLTLQDEICYHSQPAEGRYSLEEIKQAMHQINYILDMEAAYEIPNC